MLYKDKQLIILMAGKGTRLYPLTLGFPKCLLSIKQKPAIYNMIIPLIKEGLTDITMVVNLENKTLLQEFFDNSFQNKKLNINFIVQEKATGPGSALKLAATHITKPTILLLGDTLCNYPQNYDHSFIGVEEVHEEEKYKYCMIESDNNNNITKIIDKPQNKIQTNYAAVGIYYFKNYKLLKKVLKKKIEPKSGEYQLSSYFELYLEEEKIKIEKIKNWEDIGTLEGYTKTNRNNFNCRNFNSLYLDELGVMHKRSLYEKITSEMTWFKEIENTDFEKITPKFYKNNKFSTEYGIEYYDYLTLSEYLTFYPLSDYSKKVIFETILTKLLKIYDKNKIVSLEFKELFKKKLIEKTRNRIKKWNRQDLVNKEIIKIDNKDYIGLLQCLNKLLPYIEKICEKTIDYVTIIHGDIAFSNILFSPRSLNFKLIDARGNFGIDTIYGDYRYDLAKLRHCYHGRYDEIVNDLFEIEEQKNLKCNFYKNIDYKVYDEIMLKNNININDIELIEGLLFISMIPLHNDYPKRQLAFFCQGIKILNNQLVERKIL